MNVRWGIIGCGDVCEAKSGPPLESCDGSIVVNAMRRDAGKAADFARRHGIAKWTSDADELINSPDVDAVYIATPVGSHHDLAMRVAAAGKHCLVEKPMARNHAECQQMVDAFDKAKRKLFVSYYRRCLPWFVQAKDLIDSGRLGRITSAQLSYTSPAQRQDADSGWRLEVEQAGGGLFMDLASHALDLLDYLLGPIDLVHGIATNRGSATPLEDNVVMCFRLTGGAVGVGSWDFAAASFSDSLKICGTEGTLSMPVFGRRIVLDTKGKQEIIEPIPPKYGHEPLVRSVVNDLLGHGACPSTGITAARTAAVMDKVLTEYYGGRNDAFWTRPETWPGRHLVK